VPSGTTASAGGVAAGVVGALVCGGGGGKGAPKGDTGGGIVGEAPGWKGTHRKHCIQAPPWRTLVGISFGRGGTVGGMGRGPSGTGRRPVPFPLPFGMCQLPMPFPSSMPALRIMPMIGEWTPLKISIEIHIFVDKKRE